MPPRTNAYGAPSARGSSIDPESAAVLHPNDKKRVIRALEVYRETGKTMSRHNADTRLVPPRYEPVYLGLAYADREEMKRIIDSAHREGIGVSVCGELAADPYGLALLLGMGVDTLSASPRFVPGMKHMIRRLDAQTCMDMAHSVLMSTDVTASQRMLRERLQESLGSELAFHTTSIMTNS